MTVKSALTGFRARTNLRAEDMAKQRYRNNNKRIKLTISDFNTDKPYLGYSLAKKKSDLSYIGLVRAISLAFLTLVISAIIVGIILVISKNLNDEEEESDDDFDENSNVWVAFGDNATRKPRINHMTCYQCRECDENPGIPMKCPVRKSLCAFRHYRKTLKVWGSIRFCESNTNIPLGCSYPKGEKICYCNEPGCNGKSMSFEADEASDGEKIDVKNDEDFKRLKEHVEKKNKGRRFKKTLENQTEILVPFHELPIDEQVLMALTVMQNDRLTDEEKMAHLMKFYETEYKRKSAESASGSDYINSRDFERVMMPDYFKKLSAEEALKARNVNKSKSGEAPKDDERRSEVKTPKTKTYNNKNRPNNLFFGLDSSIKRQKPGRPSKVAEIRMKKNKLNKREAAPKNGKVERYMIVSNLDSDNDYIVPEVDNAQVDGKNLILPEAGRNHYFIVPKSLGELKSQEANK